MTGVRVIGKKGPQGALEERPGGPEEGNLFFLKGKEKERPKGGGGGRLILGSGPVP